MTNRAILLVEDNPDDEALTVRALKQNNLVNDIVVARDGIEALACFSDGTNGAGKFAHDLPAIVLLDLKLPRVDGLEVLRCLRADPRTRMLPVIILTSSREERDILEGYTLGANSYICKPVDFVQFTEAVKQLKLYWLMLNEFPPPYESCI